MPKIVLITGATSGIGKACAHLFAQYQYNIIITGRRDALLQILKDELETQYNSEVYPLNFDVQDNDAVIQYLESLGYND
jgi:3-hydroxy acid dehydrogenase/malonic semialdehyde reductase